MIQNSEFLQSNTEIEKCPKPDKAELAFIGRSNVGKSSLINMLTGRKALAKVSGRPGKTQLINHFLINTSWYLVDLPGYGWAKVSKTKKEKWSKMIEHYILERPNLVCLFVLIDSRLPPQAIDTEFMEWLGESQIPFCMVFTKVDKQSKNKTESLIAAYRRKMLSLWEELPPHYVTSSTTGHGKEELIEYMETLVI